MGDARWHQTAQHQHPSTAKISANSLVGGRQWNSIAAGLRVVGLDWVQALVGAMDAFNPVSRDNAREHEHAKSVFINTIEWDPAWLGLTPRPCTLARPANGDDREIRGLRWGELCLYGPPPPALSADRRQPASCMYAAGQRLCGDADPPPT